MLRLNKLYLLIAWGITCLLFYGVAARADEGDQSTKITFNGPIQLPGTTLPAGTYLFKLKDTRSTSLNVVQIFNAGGTVLYATETTIPTITAKPSDHTVVTLAQQAPDEPDALLKWFYPGESTGHEFLYPAHEQQQFAQHRHENVVANGHAESGD